MKRRRGSVSLEAVLILPMMLVLFGAVSQVMILAQSRVHVEQAAYAAARSALVHMCPPFNVVAMLKSPIAAIASFNCQDNPQKWEDAARWALVAAGSPSSAAFGRGCPDIRAGQQLMAGSNQLDGYDAALAAAMCYAYEPGTVSVSVNWETSLLSQLSGQTVIPVTATVTFQYPLSTPFRRFVDDGQRGDGTYYKTATATVTLL